MMFMSQGPVPSARCLASCTEASYGAAKPPNERWVWHWALGTGYWALGTL